LVPGRGVGAEGVVVRQRTDVKDGSGMREANMVSEPLLKSGSENAFDADQFVIA
jgi:hypothetical protein